MILVDHARYILRGVCIHLKCTVVIIDNNRQSPFSSVVSDACFSRCRGNFLDLEDIGSSLGELDLRECTRDFILRSLRDCDGDFRLVSVVKSVTGCIAAHRGHLEGECLVLGRRTIRHGHLLGHCRDEYCRSRFVRVDELGCRCVLLVVTVCFARYVLRGVCIHLKCTVVIIDNNRQRPFDFIISDGIVCGCRFRFLHGEYIGASLGEVDVGECLFYFSCRSGRNRNRDFRLARFVEAVACLITALVCQVEGECLVLSRRTISHGHLLGRLRYIVCRNRFVNVREFCLFRSFRLCTIITDLCVDAFCLHFTVFNRHSDHIRPLGGIIGEMSSISDPVTGASVRIVIDAAFRCFFNYKAVSARHQEPDGLFESLAYRALSSRNCQNCCLRCEINVITVFILILYHCLVFSRHGVSIVNGKLEGCILNRHAFNGLFDFRYDIHTARVSNSHFFRCIRAGFFRYTENPDICFQLIDDRTFGSLIRQNLAAKSESFRFLGFDNDVFLVPEEMSLRSLAIHGFNDADLVLIREFALVICRRYGISVERTIHRKLRFVQKQIVFIECYLGNRQITERYKADILGHVGLFTGGACEEIEAFVVEVCIRDIETVKVAVRFRCTRHVLRIIRLVIVSTCMLCKLEDRTCYAGDTYINNVGAGSAALQVINIEILEGSIPDIPGLFCHQTGFQTREQEFRFSYIFSRSHIRTGAVCDFSVLVVIDEAIGDNAAGISSANVLVIVGVELDEHIVHQLFNDCILGIVLEIAIVLQSVIVSVNPDVTANLHLFRHQCCRNRVGRQNGRRSR